LATHKSTSKRARIVPRRISNEAEVDRTYVTDVDIMDVEYIRGILEKLIVALKVSFMEFFNSKEFKK
jgi:hypothetical protein